MILEKERPRKPRGDMALFLGFLQRLAVQCRYSLGLIGVCMCMFLLLGCDADAVTQEWSRGERA